LLSNFDYHGGRQGNTAQHPEASSSTEAPYVIHRVMRTTALHHHNAMVIKTTIIWHLFLSSQFYLQHNLR